MNCQFEQLFHPCSRPPEYSQQRLDVCVATDQVIWCGWATEQQTWIRRSFLLSLDVNRFCSKLWDPVWSDERAEVTSVTHSARVPWLWVGGALNGKVCDPYVNKTPPTHIYAESLREIRVQFEFVFRHLFSPNFLVIIIPLSFSLNARDVYFLKQQLHLFVCSTFTSEWSAAAFILNVTESSCSVDRTRI